ncbi:hypothetical protein [Acinetobacter lwoffii]|uniref:hypothetical protein n=1 Tax=Acinetobacter lwoffii TaxID=28090 RepID=UPI0002CF9B2D|nr:hypothetical protein [Acinetobacter lwoffii]ENU62537.1 hypothetical protein F980_01863 [Acinetobacter lwoffii NIPH 715]
MDIQEIQEKFEDLLLANPDFDESLLGKDEEGCYSDSDIQHMYSMFEAGTEVREQWQSAKAQAVPDGYKVVPVNYECVWCGCTELDGWTDETMTEAQEQK